MFASASRRAPGVARHLEDDVEALDHPELGAGRRASVALASGRRRGSRPSAGRARGGPAFGSLTTTKRAPAWRATAAAIRPIGPAPTTRTSSPRTGKLSAVWTAFPNGSKIAATSSSMPGQWCQTFVTGRTTCSANAPSRLTPSPTVLAQRLQRPARQWRHRPQTTWPSPLTRSPGWRSCDVRADLEDLADELVADDERRLDRPGGPGVPRRRCGGPCRRSRSGGPGSGRR